MPEVVIFSDVHLSEGDPSGAGRLMSFLQEVGARAGRIYILGDFFDFWFGPAQGRWRPFKDALQALSDLCASGVEVVYYHGNRDFYMDEKTAGSYGFRVVRDYSIENICGQRVLLCHGDMLCTNDISYHRARRVFRHPATERFARALPPFVARSLAKIYRFHSKRSVPAKARWVIGIEKDAVLRHFALGADTIICGHTHREGTVEFDTPEGRRELHTLGDFGREGSYIECGPSGMVFRRYEPPGA